MVQYGVLSYTDTCNNVMTPTVFTNLAFHRKWIDEQMGNDGDSKTTTPQPSTSLDPTATIGITTPKGDTTTQNGTTKKPKSGDLESCVKDCLKWDEECSEPVGDLNFLKSLKLDGLK